MPGHQELSNGDRPSPTRNAWQESPDPLSDPEEQRVLFSTLDSFRQYRRNAHYNITHRRRQNLYALPQRQLKLLTSPPFSLLDKLSDVDDAVDINADLAEAILARGLQNFGIPPDPFSTRGPHPMDHTSDSEQHNKAHSTIRQFYRDWTTEGFTAEVQPLLKLILTALNNHNLPPSPSSNILHPGAGLGRLLFELMLAGYSATGNEISYHQLLGSDFILNTTLAAHSHTIYPFIASFSNNLRRAAQLRSYTIPNIHPATTLASARASGRLIGEMGMAAGDFITAFSDPSSAASFDAVVTVYFIDTAPNLIRYIETIRHCLKPNGLWVNIGPLLWHFDNQQAKDKQQQHDGRGASDSTEKGTGSRETSETGSTASEEGDSPQRSRAPRIASFRLIQEDAGIAEPGSFELADDEVLALVSSFGFRIEEHTLLPESMGGYMQDPDSMSQNRYQNSFWVARKVDDSSNSGSG